MNTKLAKHIKLTKQQKKWVMELGKRGGQARAKNLTAKRRKEIAAKAAKASAKARKRST